MNLSKLTNPALPNRDHHLLDTLNKEQISTNVNQEDQDANEENKKEIPTETTENVQRNSSKMSRSTSEYRALYNYLLSKYKAARDISRVLTNFERHLKNLSKYQQLRNNMLVDTLLFIDNNESLHSTDYSNHREIIKKLESIRKIDQNMSNFIGQLISLENEEDATDSDYLLQNFDKLVGIDDVLSSDLSIQEANIYPDNYPGNFESYEVVKKNQCFTNQISSIADLKDLVHSEPSDADVEEESANITRKRKSPSLTLGTKRNLKKANIDAISLSPVNIMPRLELYETNFNRSKKK